MADAAAEVELNERAYCSNVISLLKTFCFKVGTDESVACTQQMFDELEQTYIPMMHRDLLVSLSQGTSHSSGKFDNLSRMVNTYIRQRYGERKLASTDPRRLCFEASFLLLSYPYVVNLSPCGLMSSIEELLRCYPEFETCPGDELAKLLHFRNFMAVAVCLLGDGSNKGRFLHLITHICEGKDVKYVTGSGQSSATERRVLIYLRESGATVTRKRPKAVVAASTESSSSIMTPLKANGCHQ